MITERLKDKTATNAEVIKRAGYNVSDNHTAAQIYLENMKKPEIAKRLNDVKDEMEDTLIADVRQYNNSDDLREREFANSTARWIHDKVDGKAVVKVEQHTTGVTLVIDLTNSLTDTK